MTMATSIEIKKATLRDRIVVDVDVWMDDPEDHDFSPRARMAGGQLHIHNQEVQGVLCREIRLRMLSPLPRQQQP